MEVEVEQVLSLLLLSLESKVVRVKRMLLRMGNGWKGKRPVVMV